ncbi:hypothetical protein KC878_00270 [Candidatus Saccharibacteria bacterium]|nr:hypothetical protein [Candidatus Saccharibacteria bacterium]MCB9821049.1 hypothetical protein [Candidatus Nomurabacteria bacterium]
MNIVTSEITEIREKRQSKPAVSLLGLLIVAFLMTMVSFTMFWQSETKDTVQSIQRANHGYDGGTIAADGINNDGVLSSSELLFIQENILQHTSNLSPRADFDSSELDKSIIGF